MGEVVIGLELLRIFLVLRVDSGLETRELGYEPLREWDPTGLRLRESVLARGWGICGCVAMYSDRKFREILDGDRG